MSGSWNAELVDDNTAHVLESTVWNLGDMVVTLNDFPARKVARSEAMARSDQLDHYYIHLPLSDEGLKLEADNGERLAVAAGEPLLMDLSRPYQAREGTGRSLQAVMPREALDELLPCPRDMHAKRLQGAAAGILADLLQSLTARLPTMPAAEASSVAKGTMHLVAASLAPTPHTLERARPAIESSLLRQACRYIDLHVKETELGAAQICAALKVSRATLYRVFEPYGGVANHVKERRLVELHAAICAPGRPRPLALLAEEHGFKSAAQFSRAFRQHFGYSPSEARFAHHNAAPTSTSTAPAPRGESLAGWLRPLRG